VEKYLEGEEVFLANYSDGLTDLDLAYYLDCARRWNKIATFLGVKLNLGDHITTTNADGLVTAIKKVTQSDVRINAGFFVLKNDIFRYMRPGEELVVEPFQRLIQEQQLAAYEYDGFFAAMDTFRDKQQLDDLHESGRHPWEVWRQTNGEARKAAPTSIDTLGSKSGRVPLSDRRGAE
jgi:glucose-1-phosphate cytidylyltransferase